METALTVLAYVIAGYFAISIGVVIVFAILIRKIMKDD